MLPGSIRYPTTLAASKNVRSMPSRPCMNLFSRTSTNHHMNDMPFSAAS